MRGLPRKRRQKRTVFSLSLLRDFPIKLFFKYDMAFAVHNRQRRGVSSGIFPGRKGNRVQTTMC